MSTLEKNYRNTLIDAALSIDWDQQDASRYYIGEDAAETILQRLGFPWENGINNESVTKFVIELNQPGPNEEVCGT